jgi:ubiquinol-cytochrome c reductase iron-sulfur subunit
MQPKPPSKPGRRKFLITATSVLGGVGVAFAAVPFLYSWKPSARAQAAGAPTRVDISKLQAGEMMIVEWRGAPIFVIKHSKESLSILGDNLSRLSDPDSQQDHQPKYAQNPFRARKKGISVLSGVCTHLGCSPKYYPELGSNDFDSNWQGGFFCPCHGSKFDLAGRVYTGVPAPDNLKVPPHYFQNDKVLVIGQDSETA